MEHTHSGEHTHSTDKDFLDEEIIEKLLSKDRPSIRPRREYELEGKFPRALWYKSGDHHDFTYGHHDPLGNTKAVKAKGKDNACYTCDTITDKWIEWLLTTPRSASIFANPGISMNSAYGDSNAFLFGDVNCDTYVYFTTASPFQRPDFRRIIMTKKIPLLVPVYNVISSPQIFPSRSNWKPNQWIQDDIIKDLSGVYTNGIKATFDGDEFYGCCVIRKHSLPIRNIPKDNSIGIPEDILRDNHSTIEVYHGGFWVLIKEELFSPGDHLLTFDTQSRNYEIQAKMMISALV